MACGSEVRFEGSNGSRRQEHPWVTGAVKAWLGLGLVVAVVVLVTMTALFLQMWLIQDGWTIAIDAGRFGEGQVETLLLSVGLFATGSLFWWSLRRLREWTP